MAVTLRTSYGDLPIKLECRVAPRSARNFLELSKSGYYDGVPVHRVVPGMCLQTGDPVGDGSGGESIWGTTFDDEISARLSHSGPGVVSMANTGRNTNASQFFITFGACPHLDGKHTIIGQVNMEGDAKQILEDIAVVKLNGKGRPVVDIKIFTVQVDEDPWDGEPLPQGAAVPEKPLVADEAGWCSQQ